MATESKNQPKESTKDWRRFFSQNNLLRGKGFLINGYVQSFASDERQASGMVMTRVTSGYSVQILNAPTSYSEDWDPSSFYCNCSTKTVKSVGEWPDKYSVYTCPHEAALLLHWEEEHGPWTFKETEEEVAARLERERIEEERRKEQERIAEERRKEQERIASERSRRLEQQRREQKKTLPAQDFFPPPEDKTFFHVRLAVENRKTSLYARNRAEALLKEGTVEMEPPILSYDDYEDGTGEKVLYAEGRVGDSVDSRWAKVTISARNVKRFTCGCQGYDPFCNAPLCEHELVLLTKLREYIREHNPGDATDKAADSLFQAIGAVSVPAPEEPSQRAEKERNVVLLPRILMDGGEARLSFKAGFLGRKTADAPVLHGLSACGGKRDNLPPEQGGHGRLRDGGFHGGQHSLAPFPPAARQRDGDGQRAVGAEVQQKLVLPADAHPLRGRPGHPDRGHAGPLL